MVRSDAPRRYAIRGGNEGKERLDVLARVLLPTTTQLFDRVGLTEGMKCLDVGCGGSHVTILMARIVGSEGRVIGTDTDAEISRWQEKMSKRRKLRTLNFNSRMLARACGTTSSMWLMLVFSSHT